ncbi:hypothetical protein D3C80_1614320 [compost metagenome]
MRAILWRAAIKRQLPDHIGTRTMGIPDDCTLIFEIKQRFIALRGQIHIGEARAQIIVLMRNF